MGWSPSSPPPTAFGDSRTLGGPPCGATIDLLSTTSEHPTPFNDPRSCSSWGGATCVAPPRWGMRPFSRKLATVQNDRNLMNKYQQHAGCQDQGPTIKSMHRGHKGATDPGGKPLPDGLGCKGANDGGWGCTVLYRQEGSRQGHARFGACTRGSSSSGRQAFDVGAAYLTVEKTSRAAPGPRFVGRRKGSEIGRRMLSWGKATGDPPPAFPTWRSPKRDWAVCVGMEPGQVRTETAKSRKNWKFIFDPHFEHASRFTINLAKM